MYLSLINDRTPEKLTESVDGVRLERAGVNDGGRLEEKVRVWVLNLLDS